MVENLTNQWQGCPPKRTLRCMTRAWMKPWIRVPLVSAEHVLLMFFSLFGLIHFMAVNTNCIVYISFVEALKRNLREKIEKRNLEVPPLCFCGPTIWDTNPDTCANNCIFYKNPKCKIYQL